MPCESYHIPLRPGTWSTIRISLWCQYISCGRIQHHLLASHNLLENTCILSLKSTNMHSIIIQARDWSHPKWYEHGSGSACICLGRLCSVSYVNTGNLPQWRHHVTRFSLKWPILWLHSKYAFSTSEPHSFLPFFHILKL